MGGESFTGKFSLSLEEIEAGYRVGIITGEDGSVFMGKYLENKKVEGQFTYKCGIIKFIGKFWNNNPSDGLFIYADGRNSARVLPYD